MKRVKITDLEPEMKLAQDIARPDGAVLAKSGAELNQGMIAMIQRMANLEVVLIEGSAFETDKERRAWQKEQLQQLIHRFSKVQDDPVMRRLRKLESDRIMAVE